MVFIPIKPNAPPSKRKDNGPRQSGPLSFRLKNKIRLTIGMKPHWKRSRLTKELGLERRREEEFPNVTGRRAIADDM